MTVAALRPSIEYAEDGVSLNFAVPFRFNSAAHIEVKRVLASGAVSVLTLGSAYSVSGGETDAGGELTLISSVAGARLKIRRVTPRAQQTDYETGDRFAAATHETALDRAMLIDQEQDVKIDDTTARALLVPEGESALPVESLAGAEGKVLAVVGQKVVAIANDPAAAAASAAAAAASAIAAQNAAATSAQGVLDAANALLRTVAGMAQVATAGTAFDPLSEFTAGVVGGLWKTDKAWLWQDDAATVPVTAPGQDVAVMKDVHGVASYDMIQPVAGSRPTYFEAYGLGFLRFSNGDFMYSRAQVPLVIPSFLALAASFAGTNGRALMGFAKNTGSRHQILSGSLDAIEAAIDGTTDLAGRTPAVRPNATDFSGPDGTFVSVFHSLAKAGTIDAVFEDSAYRDAVVEKATAWANADTVAGMSLVINGSGQSGGVGTGNADASLDFYGGIALSRVPVNRAAVVAWLQGRSRPAVTAADRVIVHVSDSTGDNNGSAIAQYEDEYISRWCSDDLVARYPNDCILLRDWNAKGDTFTGYRRFSNGTLTQRTFVFNCARAGSQPDYFFAERFARAIGWLPKVDVIIWNHGQNLAVGDAAIQAHANRDLYAAGAYLAAMDQARQAFPLARHIATVPYPVGIPGDNRIEPVKKAVERVAGQYGDVTLADFYTPWEIAGRPAARYTGDNVHPSIGVGATTGVTNMLSVLVAAYAGLPAQPFPTPALIAQRRVAYAENLLINGAFETFQPSGVPMGWTTFGDGVAARSSERRLRGNTVKLTATAAGGGLTQTIDCTALAGKIVTLTVFQEVAGNSNLNAGSLRIKCNGGATIGDGRWRQGIYKSWDKARAHYLMFPVPLGATTLTIDIIGADGFNGAPGNGTVYLDRAILIAGDIPRDFII